MKFASSREHNYTQCLDRENQENRELNEPTQRRNTLGSNFSDKSSSSIKPKEAIVDRFKVKSAKSGLIYANKQNIKPLKKIKQAHIKKSNKENACLNFGTKVVSSVKNAGTSRVTYNQIFYSNKSKSSLKNYNNAVKTYLPKKKSLGREGSNSSQISYLMKNRANLTSSNKNLCSERKLQKADSSPGNNKSQPDNLELYVGGIKNKLIKTISNQQIIHKKLSTNQVKQPESEDSEFVPIHNQQDITCFEVGADSTESDQSMTDSEEEDLSSRNTTKKERKMRRIIKQANEDLFMAAESGSLRLVKQLLVETKPNCKPDINFRGPDFKTPLYAATSEGHVEIVEFLISQEALIDTRTL